MRPLIYADATIYGIGNSHVLHPVMHFKDCNSIQFQLSIHLIYSPFILPPLFFNLTQFVYLF